MDWKLEPKPEPKPELKPRYDTEDGAWKLSVIYGGDGGSLVIADTQGVYINVFLRGAMTLEECCAATVEMRDTWIAGVAAMAERKISAP